MDITRFNLSVPARINILGNPSDATEGDFATISAAVDRRAYAIIESAEDIILQQGPSNAVLNMQRFALSDIPLPYDGKLDLLKGAINRLYTASPDFRSGLQRHGFRLITWTKVPRQSGLGGSSLFVILTLAGLRALYGLSERQHNDYWLAELTQRVEEKELGITCGFADRYVPLFGGLAYLDYRGKLHHKPLGQEPYVTYERMDAWANDMALVTCTTGITHDSGNVHGPMRALYLEEYATWQVECGNPPPMVRFMQTVYDTVWQGKIALLHGNMATFGLLMDRNHEQVDAMMTYSGFEDGAGWANNRLIAAAREHGALGAKLSGAGGGGSVFALVHPGEEEKLVNKWERVCAAESLTAAQIYVPRIENEGVRIEKV